jgi:hypothetical protein
MGFSAYHIDKRSEYKVKKHKSVKSKSVSIIDNNTISIDNSDSVRMLVYDKENNAKTVYIPKYFMFDITYLEKDNYIVTKDKDDKIVIYITPLIRTILNDIKVFVTSQESLARVIKEKINASARLLIKKSVDKSKIILINEKQYIKINADFMKTDRQNFYAIVNNERYKHTKSI